MTPRSDPERLAILEEQYRAMSIALQRMSEKVDEMHEVLLKAKGAKWAILGMAFIGGYMASMAHKLVPFLWAK